MIEKPASDSRADGHVAYRLKLSRSIKKELQRHRGGGVVVVATEEEKSPRVFPLSLSLSLAKETSNRWALMLKTVGLPGFGVTENFASQ